MPAGAFLNPSPCAPPCSLRTSAPSVRGICASTCMFDNKAEGRDAPLQDVCNFESNRSHESALAPFGGAPLSPTHISPMVRRCKLDPNLKAPGFKGST